MIKLVIKQKVKALISIVLINFFFVQIVTPKKK